tara:strand:- start:3199 stop:3468 length:270 start_codon:yes stop_codon:yes gene_type:complete
MKPLLENWREYLRETIVDFSQYKAKKEKEQYKQILLVHIEGEPVVYDINEFNLVMVDTPEQYDALMDGDLSLAEELGAQFEEILDETPT